MSLEPALQTVGSAAILVELDLLFNHPARPAGKPQCTRRPLSSRTTRAPAGSTAAQQQSINGITLLLARASQARWRLEVRDDRAGRSTTATMGRVTSETTVRSNWNPWVVHRIPPHAVDLMVTPSPSLPAGSCRPSSPPPSRTTSSDGWTCRHQVDHREDARVAVLLLHGRQSLYS
jgi:hypothetical protein